MTRIAQSYWQAELSRTAEVMTLAKNELCDVRSASGIIPQSGGYDTL